MNVCDKHLLSYISRGGGKPGATTGRPEIDRPILRKLLYDSLAPGTVQWSHKLTHITPPASASNDKPTLNFSDATDATDFDLIVGADGAWSRVRPFLSEAKPFYSGIAGHAFHITDAEARHPELYKLVNRGSLFSFSDEKSIMGQYMGDGSLNVATWAVRPETWQKESGYDVRDPVAVKAMVRQEYEDWDPRLVGLTQAADEGEGGVVARDLFMLPIGHRWEHRRGVTLVGDAAHVTTPFAGEGVNIAMEDAMKLAEAIVSAASSSNSETERRTKLDEKVEEFEQDMFKRATEVQQLTYDMMESMFLTPGAPRNGIETYIIRAVEGEIGWWLTKLVLTPIVYTYFLVFKLIW